MALWDKAVAELIDIIEWTDDSSDTMVWRFPRYENEIKNGAQLIVRQSQIAILVNRGETADIFGPGQHRLITSNIPVLSTLSGWKYGFHSPFKAEVYFVNTRNFTNLKWGTKSPVMLRDPEFGPVRLRAYGTYVVKVNEPVKFIREIVGTGGHFTIDGVSEQLKNLIITRFSDMLGESGIPALELAANYNELSQLLTAKIAPEFMEYGIEVTKLLVENISLPEEVEAAMDRKSSMGVIGNLDNYLKFQSANAMEKAAENPGGDASTGIGMGMGFAMANQMGKMLQSPQNHSAAEGEPPPLPTGEKYFVGIDGKQAGPYSLEDIKNRIRQGSIIKETLVWKQGMPEWQQAVHFPEFASEMNTNPPPLP